MKHAIKQMMLSPVEVWCRIY